MVCRRETYGMPFLKQKGLTMALASLHKFRFDQNHVYGVTLGPDHFEVEALSAKDAWEALIKQPWFEQSECDCCGVRWDRNGWYVFRGGRWRTNY